MNFTLVQNERGDTWWTIKLAMDNVETLHRGVTLSQYKRCNEDPHVMKALEKDSIWGYFNHPVIVGANWIGSALTFLIRGDTVYVNKLGGMYLKDDKIKEIDHVESPAWPDFKVRGKFKIQQWKGGEHYYITAANTESASFIDPNIKYNSYDEAYKVALKYAPPERIEFEESKSYFYKREGD